MGRGVAAPPQEPQPNLGLRSFVLGFQWNILGTSLERILFRMRGPKFSRTVWALLHLARRRRTSERLARFTSGTRRAYSFTPQSPSSPAELRLTSAKSLTGSWFRLDSSLLGACVVTHCKASNYQLLDLVRFIGYFTRVQHSLRRAKRYLLVYTFQHWMLNENLTEKHSTDALRFSTECGL